MRGQTDPGRGGFVLVASLLVIALLAVVLLEFSFTARLELRAADTFRRSRQALYCAEAGVSLAAAVLGAEEPPRTHEALMEAVGGGEPIPVGEGECTVTVVEENGLINVNLLVGTDGGIVRHRAEHLLRLIDLLNLRRASKALIGYGIVPAIADWTDADREVTYLDFIERDGEGAESDHYEELKPPYRCRNGPVKVLEELLLVRGVRPDVFGARRPGGDGIAPYLTIYGNGMIDINHAPAMVLRCLSEDMDAATAAAIISARAEEPFEAVQDLRRVPGMGETVSGPLARSVTTAPARRYYRVTATGRVGQSVRVLRVVLHGVAMNEMYREELSPPGPAAEIR